MVGYQIFLLERLLIVPLAEVLITLPPIVIGPIASAKIK
jgi:hypothetical protein